MRSNLGISCLAALVATGLAISIAGPASAGSRYHDHVYADSFGNLVVESNAGYKRIIVGEGELAKKLSDYTGAGQPEASLDDTGYVAERDCYRPPVLVKGRSYMYGLSDGEMPELSPCR
jgi:hypothetical protein